jgi:ADP-heptose:LPS heptosyltransferase
MIKHYTQNGSSRLEVVILGGIGDSILMTPYIDQLASTGRYSQINCLAIPAAREIFDTNPAVTSFRAIEHVKEQLETIYHAKEYDCLHNLGLARKASVANRYCLDLYEEFFGFVPASRTPHINLLPEDQAWARQIAEKRPFVLITTDAGWDDKRLLAEHWQKIVEPILKTHAVIEIGRSNEIEARKGVKFLQPLPSLRQTAALAALAEAIICPDTYLGHLALAVHTSAIVLFGPTSSQTWGHPGNTNLSTDLCQPCTQIDDQFKTRNACTANICLSNIPPAEIVEALRLCL